jgi:hypothetical protein
LLALLVLWLLPAGSFASEPAVVFRNETPMAVRCELCCVIRGVPQRSRPYQLYSGEATPPLPLAGSVLVTISDARNPNRILYQGSLPVTNGEQWYSIVPDPGPGPLRVRLAARIR